MPSNPKFKHLGIPKSPLVEVIPYIDGPKMTTFLSLLSQNTQAEYKQPTVEMTPQGRHIQEATSATGSKLLPYSPFRSVTLSKRECDTADDCSTTIHFLIREKDRKPFLPSSILRKLSAAKHGEAVTQVVTATAETRADQLPRKQLRREKVAVGGYSAKDIIVNYFSKHFPELGISHESQEIKALNFNLCHLLSVAVANNAITAVGGQFNTQIKENIFAGSRALNEAVFPIEKTLLEFLEKNKVKEIQYMGICTPYEQVHAMAELVLKVKMITHDGKLVEFEKAFDPQETRFVSSEVTTALYAFVSMSLDPNFSMVKEKKERPLCALFQSEHREKRSRTPVVHHDIDLTPTRVLDFTGS